MGEHAVAKKSAGWDRTYTDSVPPWEIGGPQPVVVELVEQGRLKGRLLDAGCGSGEHTILAAEHGAIALGVDHSRVAIKQAVDKAADRGVLARFAVADVLELGELGERFDVVLDSGLFHVFDQVERNKYAAALGSVVRQGGVVYMTTFTDCQTSDWGPQVAERDVRATFALGWSVEQFTRCVRLTNRPQIATFEGDAFLATIRRVEPPAPVAGTAR
jgi:2-polyprenyl-3-methyl-5-hydroxy-6-metoxy-1,4-benzoquinol methylase